MIEPIVLKIEVEAVGDGLSMFAKVSQVYEVPLEELCSCQGQHGEHCGHCNGTGLVPTHNGHQVQLFMTRYWHEIRRAADGGNQSSSRGPAAPSVDYAALRQQVVQILKDLDAEAQSAERPPGLRKD